MGIFATHRALGRLSNQMAELQDKVTALETAKRSLELDFEQLYDKVRHQMSRMARRAAVESPPDVQFPEGMELPAGVARMDPISAKIHARRGIGRIEK